MVDIKTLMHCCNPADSGKRAERPHSGGLPGGRGSGLWITSPFCVDDGNHSDFGNHCGINGNGPFPGTNKIVIKDHAMGAPDVQIYPALHSADATDRFGAEGRRFLRILQDPDSPVVREVLSGPGQRCRDARGDDPERGRHRGRPCFYTRWIG